MPPRPWSHPNMSHSWFTIWLHLLREARWALQFVLRTDAAFPASCHDPPSASLGVPQSGLFTVQPLISGCAEVPSLCRSQLTGNGALEGAVMIKSNDGDLVGLRARFLPCLTAMKTASHADRKQATQQQQPTNDHHQPGKGEDTELGQKDFVCSGPFKVSPCLK